MTATDRSSGSELPPGRNSRAQRHGRRRYNPRSRSTTSNPRRAVNLPPVQLVRQTAPQPTVADVRADTLRACDGNRSRAAKALGMSRGALLRRLKRYGLADAEDAAA